MSDQFREVSEQIIEINKGFRRAAGGFASALRDVVQATEDLKAALALESYIRERNEALTTLDMEWARRMLPNATSDYVRLIAVHKARYDCVSIAPKLRHESAEWLRERGLGAMHRPLLPPRELP